MTNFYNPGIPHDRFINNPPQGGFSGPPVVPNVPIPQQLIHTVPYIAHAIANEAAAKSTMHPGRVFTYNLIANNNFMNNEFSAAVAIGAELLVLGMAKNIYRSPEEGVNDASSKGLGIFTSMCILSNPSIQQSVQVDILNDARNNVAVYQQMQQEINAIRSGQVIQQPQQMGFNQYPQQVGGTQFGQGFNTGFVQQPNMYSQPPQQQNFRNFGSSSQSPNLSINTVSNFTPVNVATATSSLRSYGNAGVQPVAQPLAFNQPATTPAPTQVPVIVDTVGTSMTSNLEWVPNEKQFYPVTISPKTQAHDIRVIEEDGKIFKISVARQLKENEMDRAQHTIEHFGTDYVGVLPMAYSTRTEAIHENTRGFIQVTGNDIVKAKESLDNPTDSEPDAELEKKLAQINSFVSPTWLIDSSINSLITSSRVKQIKANGSDAGSIYTVYGIYGDPVVVVPSVDYRAMFDKLANSSTFVEVLDVIDTLVNKLGKTTSDVYLAMRIEEYMTAVINRVLKNNLSIPKLKITSFKEDIKSLADFIGRKYSVVHKEVFQEMEDNIIKLVFGGYHASECESLTEAFVDDEDRDSVTVEFLISNYSFTQLAFHSSELNVKPFEACASLVDSSTPILYQIATALLKQERESKSVIYRRFLITSDDVIFEISKGWLTKNAITVTRLN